MKKAIRNITALILAAFFFVAGGGMNIYSFCCDACAHRCLELYFGMTDCNEVHSHHHCHEHDCYCHHHHHEADDHDCQHLEKRSCGCTMTHIANDETLPADSHLLAPMLATILPAVTLIETAQDLTVTHPNTLTEQRHAPPGGREALRENCILRI